MSESIVADEIVARLLGFVPTPVSYIKRKWLDYRRSDPQVQVVDLQRR